MKTNTHIVIKREDIFKYLTDNQIKYLNAILNTIADGRKKDGKKTDNSYYICNTDETKCLRLFLRQKVRKYEQKNNNAEMPLLWQRKRISSRRL